MNDINTIGIRLTNRVTKAQARKPILIIGDNALAYKAHYYLQKNNFLVRHIVNKELVPYDLCPCYHNLEGILVIKKELEIKDIICSRLVWIFGDILNWDIQVKYNKTMLQVVREWCDLTERPLYVENQRKWSDIWLDESLFNDLHFKDCLHSLNLQLQSNSIFQSEVKNLRAGLGTIHLVGAGPGDPNLLTIAAYQALQQADLVLADKLIPKTILDLIPKHVQIKISNKVLGNQHNAQEELNQWGKKAVLEGLRVIRLKGGDPFLFGRGGEEAIFYRKLGVEPTVVPGISSTLSAPLLANIPVTYRGIADQVLICTARRQDDEIPELPVFAKSRTLVLVMVCHRLNQVVEDLLKLKYPEDLPLAIVERASMPDMRVIKLALSRAKDIVSSMKIASPALVVVGNAVNALC